MSDADAYVNVRDLQIRAANHNKLLARRVRQPMFTLIGRDNTVARDPLVYKGVGIVAERRLSFWRGEATLVMRVPVWVPSYCQAATLTGRLAYSSASGIDLKVYGVIDAATDAANPPSTATLTVTSTTHARYSGDVVVPPDAAAHGFAMFSLYIDGTMYGADIKGGGHNAISDVGIDGGRPYIDIATASSINIGDAMYILTSGSAIRTDIAPRIVVDALSAGGAGTDDRYYIERPFNIPPLVASDLADARAVQGLSVYSLSLWPKAVAEFDAGVEMP